VCFPDPVMHNDLSRLDRLDGLRHPWEGPCLSHNVTCTYHEPHEHGPACDRTCICWRTAPTLLVYPPVWTDAQRAAFRQAWAQRRANG
jgi:hypothetical protein